MSPTDTSNLAPTDDLRQLVTQVEEDLLNQIKENMKKKEIDMKQAHFLAQDFLKLLPIQDKEDLLQKLLNLGQKYREANAVFNKYNGPHQDQKRDQKLEQMRAHIQNGEIEKAILVAKGGQNG